MNKVFKAARQATAYGLICLAVGCGSLPKCSTNSVERQTSTPPEGIESRHVIQINADGFVLDLRAGKHSAVITDGLEARAYLNDTVFSAFEASGKKKIILFVHGGLNDRKSGMRHFWGDYEEILNGEYYPVFIVWPSGWRSTYFEHLLWVRQGVKPETIGGKTFGLLTSPFMLLSDLGRAIIRLPLVVANNTSSDIQTAIPVMDRELGAASVKQFQKLAQEGSNVKIGDDYSRNSDRFWRSISYGATLPIKYIGASLIDGFGQGAWDDMLRRTVETYPARVDFDAKLRLEVAQTNISLKLNTTTNSTKPELSKQQQERAKRYLAAGLPIFVEALRKRQDANGVKEVTVVGHSMGTIILNRVLRDTNAKFANIVYMGAACSIDDFETSVLPYLQNNPTAQFYNLSLHPVAEVGEMGMADLPPRGSLLVWLDNFLLHPVTEQERTLGRWENLFRSGATGEPIIRSFYASADPATLNSQLHFHAFSIGFGNKDQRRNPQYQWNMDSEAVAVSKRCDTALKHGDFSNMPYWLPSYWWQ